MTGPSAAQRITPGARRPGEVGIAASEGTGSGNGARLLGAGATCATCLALLALCVLVYRPLPGFRPVEFADAPYLSGNPAVEAGLTREGLRFALTDLYSTGGWNPVTWLSFMAGVELHGTAPRWHLLANVLLHGANSLLLFLVLRAMTGAHLSSALCAALFAVHPLAVEPVAWLPGRRDLLAGFFVVLALRAYTRYCAAPRKARLVWPSVLFALGMASKPTVAPLPLALVLLDFWPFARPRRGAAGPGGSRGTASLPSLLLEKAPLAALAVAGSAVNLVALSKGGLRSLSQVSTGFRLALTPISALHHAAKTAWPADLAFFYPYPSSPPPWWVPGAAAALLAAVTALAVRARRRPALAVGWLWFLVMLSPVLGIVQVNEMAFADRHAYLPMIGLFAAAVWGSRGVRRASAAASAARSIAGLLVVAALALSARARLGHWKDGPTLMSADLAVTEDNWLAEYNLGVFLQGDGRAEEAAGHYREAARIKPGFPAPHDNLGVLMTERGDAQEALRHFLAALRLDPGNAATVDNMGNLLYRQGDLEGAAGRFERAISLDPGFPPAHYHLGLVHLRRGRPAEALEEFSLAIGLNPDYAEAHRGRGLALEALRRRGEPAR